MDDNNDGADENLPPNVETDTLVCLKPPVKPFSQTSLADLSKVPVLPPANLHPETAGTVEGDGLSYY